MLIASSVGVLGFGGVLKSIISVGMTKNGVFFLRNLLETEEESNLFNSFLKLCFLATHASTVYHFLWPSAGATKSGTSAIGANVSPFN